MAGARLSMACLNWWTALFFVSLVNWWTYNASGILIVKPQNTHVLAGQVAILNCSTSLAEDVHWYYETVYIYAGKKLYHPYIENFKVEVYYKNDGTTAYNLVFLAAKPEDAGTYNCRDNQGRGDMSSAEMTVFTADGNQSGCQSNMKPDGVVIPNDCNIDPDEIQLSCRVAFYGKNPPQLQWKKVHDNGDSAVKTECQTANNRVTCNASVIGDQQMNRSSYECQTTGSSQLNIKLCTIEVKNLIYASSATITKKSSVGTEVQCNPETSQSCRYKWKYSEIVVSTIRSMTPDKTGLYQCEAECYIRGKRCIVFDYAYIHVLSQDYAYISQGDDSTSCSIGCVVAICLTILVLILTFIFLLLLKKERSKNQQPSNKFPEEEELELSSMANEAKHERTGLRKPPKEKKKKIVNRPTIDEPSLIRTMSPEATFTGNAICGLTILGNELFISIMEYQEIEVFDLQKLEFSRKFSLQNYTLEIPWDMQASSRFGCLYVVDDKKAEEQFADIIKIDPMGNVQKAWPAKCKVCRLSITREFNVIVTSLRHHSIREYSPDGKLIFEIALTSNAGIVRPRVTLKQSTNAYIVSHGYRGDSQHMVCVIDRKGNLKHQFGGRKGSTNEQLNLPVHMSTYSNGHILVADTENSRVMLLSPTLAFIEAFSLQNLRFPNRICLDEQNKRLFVSDNHYIKNINPWTDGKILVYDMSNVQLT